MRVLFYILAGIVIGGCVQPLEEEAGRAGNRNPVIQSVTASPSQFSIGGSSTVTVVASDPDNDPLTYRWSASTGDIIGEGATIRYSASFCCAGPNLIYVTVKDNGGGTATETINIFIFYPNPS